jgi:peptide/nickel transport system substrate-binding protein
MKTGEIQVMATDNGQNIKNFKDNKSFHYTAQDKFNDTFYVLMNVGQPGSPLQDQNVRCGLAAATDTKTLASVIGQDQFPVANGLFSPSQQGYLSDTGNQQYDVAKAKQFIKTWSDAHGGQKPKIIYTTTTDSTALQAAQLLQQWWDEAGADVQILQLEQSKLITNALLGDPQFMAFGWRNHAGYVVDNQYFWWHSSQALPPGQLAINFGRLRDPVIDQLLDDAHTNPDLAKETADAQAVNREFAKQCWVIPEMWVVWGIVSLPKVQGLDGSTFPGGTGQLGTLGGIYWLNGAWLKS